MMTKVIKDSKVTAALWGPLDEVIFTGHENGDLVQWDVKVTSMQCKLLLLKCSYYTYRHKYSC